MRKLNENEKLYKAIYTFSDLGMFGYIPGIKDAMKEELMRVYNIYARMANSGITEHINKEFKMFYPTYDEDNKDKDFWELTTYIQFMAERLNKYICDKLNRENVSQILDFYVSEDDLMFTGCLKVDHSKTVYFELKEVEL